jgi:hypothetical protein
MTLTRINFAEIQFIRSHITKLIYKPTLDYLEFLDGINTNLDIGSTFCVQLNLNFISKI